MYHHRRYQYRYNYLASSAANTMVFVAALENAELLCTIVLDTGTGTIQ